MLASVLKDCETAKKVRRGGCCLESADTVLPVYATSVGGRYASGWLILAFQAMPSIAASPRRIAASGSASIRSSSPQVLRFDDVGPHFRWS